MSKLNEIFIQVANCMEDSCGIERDEIKLENSLIDDLGIDSIDLMDLMYSLEKQYSISIEMGEFEKIASSELGDIPFAVDNIITTEGLEMIKQLMPEVPADKIVTGLTVQKIPFLFTVESLCNLVIKKIESK